MRRVALRLLRPLLWLLCGLSVGGREHLPRAGPALVAANHNSHLDTLLVLAAFPPHVAPLVTPVGASDYWERTALGRAVTRLVGLTPLDRRVGRGADPLGPAREALAAGRILLVFPEGTRGRPEEMGALKGGLSRLAREAGLPVTPVYIQGAGRILPKGTRVPVPFTVTVLARLKAAAPPLHWS
jgi:1-acyl-sn-glycerol-3-phosphate acyltransferase